MSPEEIEAGEKQKKLPPEAGVIMAGFAGFHSQGNGHIIVLFRTDGIFVQGAVLLQKRVYWKGKEK